MQGAPPSSSSSDASAFQNRRVRRACVNTNFKYRIAGMLCVSVIIGPERSAMFVLLIRSCRGTRKTRFASTGSNQAESDHRPFARLGQLTAEMFSESDCRLAIRMLAKPSDSSTAATVGAITAVRLPSDAEGGSKDNSFDGSPHSSIQQSQARQTQPADPGGARVPSQATRKRINMTQPVSTARLRRRAEEAAR